MKKEYIIVLLLIGFIFFMRKKARAGSPENISETPERHVKLKWNQVKVKSGDSISKMLLRWAKEEEEISKELALLEQAIGKNQSLLLWTKMNAEANGKDWKLYNDKASSNPLDPDTLKVGDKLTLWNPNSFAEIYGKLSEKGLFPDSYPLFYNDSTTGELEPITFAPESWLLSEFGENTISMVDWGEDLIGKYNKQAIRI
jgi:hypothetical protein